MGNPLCDSPWVCVDGALFECVPQSSCIANLISLAAVLEVGRLRGVWENPLSQPVLSHHKAILAPQGSPRPQGSHQQGRRLLGPEVRGIFPHVPNSRHWLVRLQFNSDTTTWRWRQIPQVEGSVPKTVPPNTSVTSLGLQNF